jgi:hypothetical protein
VLRRVEEFGIDLAELAAELPARLNRISESIETGGLEIHVRTDEMDAPLARTERLGNRVAASVLAATLINSPVRLEMLRRGPPLDWAGDSGGDGRCYVRGHRHGPISKGVAGREEQPWCSKAA